MTEIELLLMEKLAAKATPADTDTMIVAEGNVLKKSTISQLVTFLKEKLGINSLNTKLTDKYVLARIDTVIIPAGDVAGNTITSGKSVTFNRVSDDALCIAVLRGAGWLGCTGTSISGNVLTTYFYSWSGGTHSGAGTFDILQFVKVS